MAESRRKNLGRKILGWLIFLAVITAPVVYYFLREPTIEVTAVTLKKGHVEQSVTAFSSGTVKPKIDSIIASGTLGKVVAIPVKEGDRVKANDILVELEHAELDGQVELAEANVRVGLSRMQQAKIAATIYEEIARTRVSQAAAQFSVAKADFDRIKALADRKSVSQSDFDKVTLALRVSEETDAAAKAAQKENLVRQEEIRSTEAAIEQLEAGAKVSREMRDKAYVRAPFDGVVSKIMVHLGESVGGLSGLGGGGGGGLGGAGFALSGNASVGASASASTGLSSGSPMGLLQLVDDSQFYVKAPFDEANAAQIKVSQKARINLDAYRSVDFPGVVDYVSPTVTLNLDLSRTLDINVRILEGQDKFVAGMSADVIIVASEKDDALYVPTESLVREEYVFAIENNRAVRRPVKIGIGNYVTKEIVDGLREGETIITSVGIKELKNGVKVRQVEALAEK